MIGVKYDTWIKDYTKVIKLIDEMGWTFELEGQRYVSNSAPEDVIRQYDSLRQIGYANGFFS